MKLLIPSLRKTAFRGHPTSKLGVFGVIWGQITKMFKPEQIIYQNEAFGLVITKKWFSRSVEVTLPRIWGIWGHFGPKFKVFQTLTNYTPK